MLKEDSGDEPESPPAISQQVKLEPTSAPSSTPSIPSILRRSGKLYSKKRVAFHLSQDANKAKKERSLMFFHGEKDKPATRSRTLDYRSKPNAA